MSVKREVVIRLVCVIILVVLNLAIVIHGLSLSCDKCVINFRSQRPDEIFEPNNFSVKLLDVYDYYLRDKCLVEFDENGFRINK